MKQTRRSLLRSIGAGTAIAVGGVGAASAKPPREGDTIVKVATEADGFNVLVAAVQEAGLADTLSGNRQLTVFGPTDDAFNEAGITVDNVGEADDEFLADVLTYHVAPGERDAASVLDSEKIPTLNGALIDVNADDLMLNDGQAEIIQTNIGASNGFIHVIDGVLMP